jgi:hypothetical protein
MACWCGGAGGLPATVGPGPTEELTNDVSAKASKNRAGPRTGSAQTAAFVRSASTVG